MKPLLALLALSLGLIAVVPVANAQTGDSVTGGAAFSSPFEPGSPAFTVVFDFDAHSGPSGENPSGTAGVAITTPFGDDGAGGSVTCLNVAGDRATIGTFEPGLDATFFFISAGGGTVGFGSVLAQTAPHVCPLVPGALAPFSRFFEPRAMDASGITIHDAPPLPTSRDQCNNGGWRSFGIFKNQGACVSFVATGGKNPPVGSE